MPPVLLKPERFRFPGNALPGFDPAHPAGRPGFASNIVFSGVLRPGRAFNLTPIAPGRPFNSLGATYPVHNVIGPTIKWGAFVGQLTIGGVSNIPNMTSGTLAAIFLAGGSIVVALNDGGSTGASFVLNGKKFGLNSGSVGGQTTSDMFSADGDPVFAAASWTNTTGNANFVCRNLQTGRVVLDVGTLPNFGAATGTVTMKCGSAAAANLGFAAVMASYAGLSAAELLKWSEDPWSFWYPRAKQAENLIYWPPPSVVAAPGGVTYPQLERGIRGLHRGVAIGGYR